MVTDNFRVVLLTSDKGNWLLRGFFHQWGKYAGDIPVTIAGFTPPVGLHHPAANFHSIGRFSDYPADRWTDAVIKFLQTIRERLVLIVLEDYWLIEPVNWKIIKDAAAWMAAESDVLRFSLTTDRHYAENRRNLGRPQGWEVDLIEALAPSTYQMSYQANLWNRIALLNCLVPGETPWQSELTGTARLNKGIPYPYRVMGTSGSAMQYQIMVQAGTFRRDGSWMFPPRQMADNDFSELEKLGYTTHE